MEDSAKIRNVKILCAIFNLEIDRMDKLITFIFGF